MTERDTVRWLAALQQRFGEVLRQPLDRKTHVLRAELERYPEHTIEDLADGPFTSARQRVAVYHRQYWFRLFDVMQREFPLTARLLGMWDFNALASRFLELHPPRDYDLHAVADGFAEFLSTAFENDPSHVPESAHVQRSALVEASRIDEAYRAVFAAPSRPSFEFSQEHAARLPQAHLIAAPGWQLAVESWPLVDLRRRLMRDSDERPVLLPERHPAPKHWLIIYRAQEQGALPLDPVRGRLLQALREHTVSHALAVVEQSATRDERELLLARAQAWLADSVRRGLWSGLG